MIGLISLLLGDTPNPGVVAGFMLIGIGLGMVVARYGNMGPFQGEFGSPWFEAGLSELLRKEVARAARFDRDLSIAVVRQHAGDVVDWTHHMRQADDIITCRNGWHVLVLPETPKDGAQSLIERATAGTDAAIQAVILDPSVVHLDAKKLGNALLDLVRNPPAQNELPVTVRRGTDRLRWPAG